MHSYQQEFMQLALDREVLKFGEFKLKSGRTSPYFFNLGLISDGDGMNRLGSCYAQALQASTLPCDMLFGPAYKGIPLVTATAMAMADTGRNLPYAYNRKEAKDHGEGGQLVGAPLSGQVVIIDDVMTAGTAVREAVTTVRATGAEVAGILIALDRQERGSGETSAVQAFIAEGIPVASIINLDQIIEFLTQQRLHHDMLPLIHDYRSHYGTETTES